MKLKKFSSYEEYVRVQTEDNIRKLDHVWVKQRELEKVAKYIKRYLPAARFGLCHGVRNGFEVTQLRRLLGMEIIGTEISETAHRFDNVIQWDFHEVKEEWKGGVDFIYSNSWDHSYDPELLLERWISCLSSNGRIFLEWTRNHMPKSVYRSDCFGIDFKEFKEFIEKKYTVESILSFNKLYPTDVVRQPVVWAKGVIAPVRVIVVKGTKGRHAASALEGNA